MTRCVTRYAVFWTFSKKVDFDDSREIFDYQIIGDVNEGGVKKIEVIAFKAPKAEIAAFKHAFQNIGYPLKGVTIVPFAIQNLFRSQIVCPPEESVCCLFIGRDWSRIAVYHNGSLVLSRGIKAGMYSMIEAVNVALLKKRNRNRADTFVSQADSEDSGHTTTIHPRVQKLFFDFLHTSKNSADASAEVDGHSLDYLFQTILPAIQRLVRQVERTFEHYALNFNREGVRRIYISGQVTASDMIVDYIGKQLEMPIIVMDPFGEGTSFAESVHVPQSVSERESYVPAIGLALSNNQMTPNFLYTHQDKDRFENERRINMRVLTFCMIFLIALIGVFSWQERRLDDKRAQIAELSHRLQQYSPPAEKDILMALYAQTRQKRQTINRIVRRYAPAAVMNELAQITPSNIRLLRVTATFGEDKSQNRTTLNGEQGVVIEGIIFGDRQSFEPALTGYLLSLKNSPIFQKPNVKNKRVEYYNTQNVLRFVAGVELL